MIPFITTNEGKFEEFRTFLAPLGIGIEMVSREYPEVQADSLGEVALYGASVLSEELDEFMLEDSGFFIDPLPGFPGVYSKHVHSSIGLDGVLKLVGEDRRARFVACILYHDGEPHVFEGEVRGSVAREKRGAGGFGYDPIFIPEGHDRTFAEMTTEEKNGLSHRGRALEALAEFFRSRGGPWSPAFSPGHGP